MVISADALKLLKCLYKGTAKTIQTKLEHYARHFIQAKSTNNKINWHKNLILYTVYPDGICYARQYTPLQNLSLHIPHLKKLSCNAMYILPFLESPLIDAGFDVSNHYMIRKDLGNLADLKEIIKKAKQAGIHLFMDLILNHVSNQHPWAQQARAGNQHYRQYFCTTHKKPVFLGKVHAQGAVFAKYKINKKTIKANIAFPEFTGPIPHWQKHSDGYWYYHTFRPEQLDLNWNNPDVFIELAKVMLYWGSLGFNFRLDAIPYVGRSAYKLTDKPTTNGKGKLIMSALKLILQAINPQAIFLAESYENLPQVISYFGGAQQPLAHLSYNFHLTTNIWISLIKKDNDFILNAVRRESHIPLHACWLNFLRNHDELSFAHLNTTLTREMMAALLKLGENFREGHGISGRTYSLLGSNKKRFLMAYFLLASLPGSLMLPYGDEIAYPNINRRKLSGIQKTDTRYINRGKITRKDFNHKANKKILHAISALFAKRRALNPFFSHFPQPLPINKQEILLLQYKNGLASLIICINLTSQRKVIRINSVGLQPLHAIDKLIVAPDKITLFAYAGVWLTNIIL